jgi:hypothetical protein
MQELAGLIDEGRVAMIGPIRQELLSGIRDRDASVACVISCAASINCAYATPGCTTVRPAALAASANRSS